MAFDVQGFSIAAKQKGYSQAQVDSYLSSKGISAEPLPAPAEQKSLGGFLGNIVGSAGNLIGGIAGAVAHPIQTVGALGSIAAGGVEKLVPGTQKHEASFDALASFFKQRYGSLPALGETLYKDPVGVLADISTVAGGAGLAARGVATAAKTAKAGGVVTQATKAAQAFKTASDITNPLSAVTSLGKVTEKATKGKKIAPFGKAFMPVTAGLAREYAVPLSASSKSKSPFVHLVETATARGPQGGKLQALIESAEYKLNLIAEQTVRKSGATTNLTEAGNIIAKGRQAYEDAYRATRKELYNKVDWSKVKGAVPFSRTIPIVDRVIAELERGAKVLGSKDESLKFFQNLRNSLAGESGELSKMIGPAANRYRGLLEESKITAQDVDSALSILNQKIRNRTDPVSTGHGAALKEIATTLDEDLKLFIKDANPEVYSTLLKADEFYQKGLMVLNSPYAKKIKANADRPDVIAESIINGSMSVEDIKTLYSSVGQEAVEAIQATFLKDFFESARSKTTSIFTPGGIQSQMNKYGDHRLKVILTPEQLKVVKDLNVLSKSVGQGRRIAEGSQTFYSGRIMGIIMSLFTNPFLGLKIVLGDTLLSKLVSSEKGQALLTEGLELSGATGRGIQKVGELAKPLVPVERLTEAQTSP